MSRLSTASVSVAVTPVVVSTFFSHYLNKKSLKERPTAHLSYDEGLHLVRAFLEFASHHTIEELQGFTSQWVPIPRWVKVERVTIPLEHVKEAADVLQQQLGSDGVEQVGGRKWWQWRKPDTPLGADWIEMRADANRRKTNNEPLKRVMLYIHGGAYFFGSVDEHRYQMQRHARKLQARVFAPRYRLAPQFPFPCGLYDCLAAYLYLLSFQDPSTIVMAGDSAGGGMAISLLCILRDQGIPLPAGGILISPWVDLTHSFPSVAGEALLDYIPSCGFHYKPSRAWPPPNEDEMARLRQEAKKIKNTDAKKSTGRMKTKDKHQPQQQPPPTPQCEQGLSSYYGEGDGPPSDPNNLFTVTIDGQPVVLKDQIQLYTTNSLLVHPLVSPVLQPTLGGLPPLLIMVGGGEVLRDEQIYLAHKCANPAKYALPTEHLTGRGRQLLEKHKPTDVQLQVWDDLCHVAPTLSFTRPAKYMYRSIAQFGAWALARAQHTGIDIPLDEDISVSSGSDTDVEGNRDRQHHETEDQLGDSDAVGQVGSAGDPLPAFKNHMIRQRVTRKGVTMPLVAETELPGCCMKATQIGVIKEGPSKKWLAKRADWDRRFASTKTKVQEEWIKEMAAGLKDCGPGEHPPPTALVAQRRTKFKMPRKRTKTKSLGLALWSGWGSKHDDEAVERERKMNREAETLVTASEHQGARPFSDIESESRPSMPGRGSRSRSRIRTVVDENQTGGSLVDENTPIAKLMEARRKQDASNNGMLSPGYVSGMGVTGKRPVVDGVAVPFSLNKEAETASMMTLQSHMTTGPGSRPLSPAESKENLQKHEDRSEETALGTKSGLNQPAAGKEVEKDQAAGLTDEHGPKHST